MAYFDYDIGIIGGGAAGLTVTSGAAQLGAKTILIEKESMLGGDCLHYGCVPSKTLIKSAHVYQTMKNAVHYGLPSVPLAPVDFSQVAARIKGVIGEIQKHDSVERFNKLGAEVAFGVPRFRDEHRLELAGRTLSAKQWVVATGSSAAIPPFPGLTTTPHITNKEIFYLDRLPASLIVLGAGPIAVEMAQAFARLGSQVTVIQRSNQILSREDKDMADLVMAAMTREGVVFHLDVEVEDVRDLGDKRQVTIKTKAGELLHLQGETILVALGRNPNTQGLGLAEIGVEFSRHGIVVDNRLRTSQTHIYAPGDINGRYQFTHAAGYEGGIVISNALFHLPRKANYTWLPWATYCDPELASIGMNEKAARKAGLNYTVWMEEFAGNDRARAEGLPQGQIKMLLDRREKPLGVQICGPHAGELISEWVAVLNSRMKLSGLAGAIHAYPTLAEINKRVAGSSLAPKIFSPTVKKWLKFFFKYRGGLG
ncbi:MAG: FAD-dependent oxidoreductase [Proteobacteria bacterium]|nr:FAD-dependent oxidoreductase [Pseudomonadota bacterium]